MPTRVLAFIVALVLLWSGFATIEPPHVPAVTVVAQSDGLAGSGPGSVADHHLDDQPSQAVGDTPPETPALLAQAAPAPGAAAAGRARRAGAMDALAPPCLAGPLRPPCTSS